MYKVPWWPGKGYIVSCVYYGLGNDSQNEMFHLSLEGAIRNFWQMGPEKDISNRRMSADHEIMKQRYMCFENSKFDLVV